jgi:hypothetical protein
MTRTKRYLLGGVAAVALLGAVARPAKALLPVIDVPALQEWVQQLESDIRQYALQTQQFFLEETAGIRQAQQLATQLQQYAQEIQLFLNFAHAPLAALTQLMGQYSLGNSLPINPQSALNLIEGWRYGAGGFGQIAGLLNQMNGFAGYAYQQNHLYTPTDGSFQSQQVIDRANGIAGTQGAMEAAYADDRTHEAILPPLQQQMFDAKDTKAVLDASAQVQSEIAWNVNQLNQQQAIATMAEVQRDNLMQRDNERLSCEIEQFINNGPPCPQGVAPAAP